jgi:hypothetical protein
MPARPGAASSRHVSGDDMKKLLILLVLVALGVAVARKVRTA